jgi:parallel beta-helix repeat protein
MEDRYSKMLRALFVAVGMVFLGIGPAQAVDGICGSASGNLIGTAPTTILCGASAPSPAGSMTTYYVSSAIGHDDNAGTSAAAPLATLQAAANLVKPGDTVEVMNGTYSPFGINTSGTASAPITFEAAPGQTPVVDSSGQWGGIYVSASWIDVNGFTVVGDAANYTLSSAMAGYSTNNPSLDGQGIVIDGRGLASIPSHITLENNTVYNEPGGGIAILGADYLQILNNTVHDTSHWSAYGTSGISIAASVNTDTAPGAHIIVSGNTVYNNAELVPEYRAGIITDGEGIILDSNQGYTGGFLVQNNIAHDNGGPGIMTYLSNNAVISHNAIWNNDSRGDGDAGVAVSQSNNITVSDNTGDPGTEPPPPPPPPPPTGSGFVVRGRR